MNETLKLIAIVAAFIAGTLAFIADETLIGVLAVLSGVLVAVTIIRKERK